MKTRLHWREMEKLLQHLLEEVLPNPNICELTIEWIAGSYWECYEIPRDTVLKTLPKFKNPCIHLSSWHEKEGPDEFVLVRKNTVEVINIFDQLQTRRLWTVEVINVVDPLHARCLFTCPENAYLADPHVWNDCVDVYILSHEVLRPRCEKPAHVELMRIDRATGGTRSLFKISFNHEEAFAHRLDKQRVLSWSGGDTAQIRFVDTGAQINTFKSDWRRIPIGKSQIATFGQSEWWGRNASGDQPLCIWHLDHCTLQWDQWTVWESKSGEQKIDIQSLAVVVDPYPVLIVLITSVNNSNNSIEILDLHTSRCIHNISSSSGIAKLYRDPKLFQCWITIDSKLWKWKDDALVLVAELPSFETELTSVKKNIITGSYPTDPIGKMLFQYIGVRRCWKVRIPYGFFYTQVKDCFVYYDHNLMEIHLVS